jgi:hypothetical protein
MSPGSRSSSTSSLYSSPSTSPNLNGSPFGSRTISTIPEEVEREDLVDIDEEEKLHDISKQIKATLTDLLNSDASRNDGKFRVWVQSRLMDAEMELRRHRKRRMSADKGREDMVESIAGGLEY